MTYKRYGRECEPEKMNAIEFSRKAINYDRSDVNKLNKHNTETIVHFLAKATAFYLLRNLGHEVITEFCIEGIGKGDLLDLKTRVQYEIETQKSIANINKSKEKYKQAGVELVIIQIRNVPADIHAMKEHIQQFIRPD